MLVNKTKIIATVGPSSYKRDILEGIIDSGVDVIRINMSYANYQFCEEIIDAVDEINEKNNSAVSIMLDLEGPCIRTGEFTSGEATFKTGDKIRVYMNKVMGNNVQFSVNYSKLIDDLKYRSIIKLSEGAVVLEVAEKGLDYAVLEVLRGGIVKNYSKVYLPGIKLNRKFLTKQDKEDILFANKTNIDFVAISNITDAEDVLEISDLLIGLGNNHISLLAKIQNESATEELDNIIDAADGIVLCRNDLSIEIPLEKVPNIKNDVIKKCHDKGKVSIVTAEVSSFIKEEIVPNRSEVSDLANLTTSSVDAIMLTSETTVGKHPLLAVQEIEKVVRSAEEEIDYEYFFNSALKTEAKNIAGTIASSVALGAIELKCKAIIIATNSGYTARQMSRLRPPCIIIAAAPNRNVAKTLNMHFGVVPVVVDEFEFDSLSAKSTLIAQKLLDLNSGDKVIITGGYPFKVMKHTNFMMIEEI